MTRATPMFGVAALVPIVALATASTPSFSAGRAETRLAEQGKDLRMTEDWKYQIRLNLGDEFAEIARSDPGNPAIRPIAEILSRHHAELRNQFDAFADYVAEAERQGIDRFPLYKWTKATIEDPVKKAKHVKAFSIHIEGEEVYPKAAADALEAELAPLVGGGVVEKLSKHDTNPAHNPQAPSHLR